MVGDVEVVEFGRELSGGELGAWVCRSSVLRVLRFAYAGDFASGETHGGEKGGSLADAVVAVVKGFREPGCCEAGRCDDQGDHALKSPGLELWHFVFVIQTDENGGKLDGIIADFGAECGFSPDERGGGFEGQFVAVVVLEISQACEEVDDVSGPGQ